MSDISGPPAPKPIQSVTHGTEKAAATSKDPKHTGNPTTDEKGEQRAHQDNRHALEARDPAVSIAATAAHIRVGEELRAPVLQQDAEGRPIIETPTATFALKPSAGLKPGDDAVLKITETGKQVTADLLARNNIPLNPPINVQLIVISIHNTGSTTEAPQQQAPHLPLDVRINSVPYKPTNIVKNIPISYAATLLAQSSGKTHPDITDHTSFKPPADNPDQAIIRASSQDLATLLSAQQEKTVADAQRLSDQIAAQNQKPVAAPQYKDGLGPIISATTFTGATVNLQVIDPSISQVPPREVAQVVSQTAITAADVKTLPVSLLTASATSELVRLETDKGEFIVPAKEAATLQGESIRVAEAVKPQQQQVPVNNLPTYEAKLSAPENGHTRQVSVRFPEAGSNNVSQLTTEVQGVHTLRAFLSASGPRSDIRLETPLGDIKITLDNTVRPNAGDLITIIPQPSSSAVNVPLEASQQLAPLVASSTGNWPNLQEAFSVLAQTSPDAANALASKTASTGGKVTNSLLFLMSALKGGGTEAWLGNKVETVLNQANSSLLQALKSDISRLLNTAGETIGDWRTFVVPTDPRGDMPLIALLFGQPGHINPDDNQGRAGSDDQTGSDSERFILEVLFSVLGTVQLDGYIRDRKFDLTVRTEMALPMSLEHDTRNIFADALLANNFSGSLSFIAGEEFPVSAADLLESQSER